MERYIGLDVHSASCTAVVVDSRGKRVGTHQLEVRVVGPETVSVPAGSFSCVQLDEREIWPTGVHEGAVWLARGVGIVRRVYTTGRTEVLTNVRFP